VVRISASQRIRSKDSLPKNNTTTLSTSTSTSTRSFTNTSRPCSLQYDYSSSSQLIDVTPLAESLRRKVRSYTHSHPNIKLAGVLAHAGPFRQDAEIFSQRIAETCWEDGIHFELLRCTGGDPSTVSDRINTANSRSDIDGILIFYPIFAQPVANRGPYKNRLTGVYYKTQDDYLRDLVATSKDVEGLCGDYNARWLFRAGNRPTDDRVVPCTALSVKLILDHFHHAPSWNGQIVSVVNRSEIMGRPLAAMLALEGAIVYSIDVDSILQFRPGGRLRRCTSPEINLEWCLRQSSVVVTGVPSPEFQIPAEAIAPGTTVVNVSEFTNVCEDTLLGRPGVKYIPQVGKVTVAVLEHNLLRLHRKAQRRIDK
jgi:methylenetetrahydrofolate dehydrogenase (NAD+)